MHLGETGRNGDELTDGGNKAAHQCGNIAVLAEIVLCLLHFCAVEQQHVTHFAVGEPIDDRASEPKGQHVVDESSDEGSERGEQND